MAQEDVAGHVVFADAVGDALLERAQGRLDAGGRQKRRVPHRGTQEHLVARPILNLKVQRGLLGEVGRQRDAHLVRRQAEARRREEKGVEGLRLAERQRRLHSSGGGSFLRGADLDALRNGLAGRRHKPGAFMHQHVAKWLAVLTAAFQTVVFGQDMQEPSLVAGHGFVADSDFTRALREDAEFTLLRLAPCRRLLEQGEGLVRVWYMVVGVRRWVDVERRSKASIALLSQALIVTFELRSRGFRIGAAGKASDLLLADAARACNFCLTRTCCRFIAWVLAMATILATVLTEHLYLAAYLTASAVFQRNILAVSRSMAQLFTKV